MRADLLCPAQSFGMEADSSDGHASGPRGPNLPRGAPQAHEPPGEPRAEEQQRQSQHGHKPLFYLQPSQPFLPMQGLHWPLPMAVPLGYNPYFGCPPLGYGMPMIPHYQHNPYMEHPAFIMPQTHHHLTDYRRILNPYYYRTMAYHARRYRYQHNVPAKEVTSSEVQTEPLSGAHMPSNPVSGNPEALEVCRGEDTPSGTARRPPQPDSDECTLEVEAPPNGSFVIQTEEVTIECCDAPVGLKRFQSRQTEEVSLGFPTDDELDIPAERTHHACPDILVLGTPGEKILELEEQDAIIESKMVVQEMTAEEDLQLSVQSQAQERPVWSVEDTLLASPDSLTLTEESEGIAEEVPTDEPPAGDGGPSEEDQLICEAEVRYAMEECPELKRKAEAPLSPALGRSRLEDESQPKQDLNFQEHQDTSFESLPAYLPSSSWQADFDRVNIYSRMPATPKKQNQAVNRTALEVPSRRRKLDLEQPSVRKPKERYKPRSKIDQRSLSDHECCLTRTFNENILTQSPRLCARCLAKSGPALKRKAVPFQQRNQALMSTCDDCKSHTNKRHPRKASVPDIRAPRRQLDTEGESSENGSWRPDGQKRPLGSKQNWTCDEAQTGQLVAREGSRHCPHGNAIRELDENLPVSPQDKWRNAEQLYWMRRWQTDKSRKMATANPDSTRSPHLKKHKMSQSQGIYRQDARC
ncbi:uncharacterized protein LOC144040050 isoform X2 [Vanacampus margaritifer]